MLGAMLAAGAALAGPAAASECTPARLGHETTSLPEPWRLALEALVAATAREGQPWSCPRARVSLIPPSDRGLAQLEVEDAAGVRRRPVAAPADVVPLGEAMLARTLALEAPGDAPGAPPRPAGDAADRPLEPAATPPPPSKRGPQLLVDVLAGARFTGPTRAVLMGPELRAALVFDRWSAGLMARYDTAVSVLQTVPEQFSLSSVSVGLTGGYRFLVAPVELTVDVEPTLAVVLMGAVLPGQEEPDVDARIDMRLGARLGAVVPINGRVRAVCALGGEGAPAALFGDRSSRRKALPSLPGYLLGLSVGVEVAAIP